MAVQEEVQPGSVVLPFRHRRWNYTTARLYKKKCIQAVQEEVHPGCTRRSASRLYKKKCIQAVEPAFYYKRRELQFSFLIEAQFYIRARLHLLLYNLAALPLVQPGCSVVLVSYSRRLVLQPGCTSLLPKMLDVGRISLGKIVVGTIRPEPFAKVLSTSPI